METTKTKSFFTTMIWPNMTATEVAESYCGKESAYRVNYMSSGMGQ